MDTGCAALPILTPPGTQGRKARSRWIQLCFFYILDINFIAIANSIFPPTIPSLCPLYNLPKDASVSSLASIFRYPHSIANFVLWVVLPTSVSRVHSSGITQTFGSSSASSLCVRFSARLACPESDSALFAMRSVLFNRFLTGISCRYWALPHPTYR